MSEEWGPWIEHDGSGVPVPRGTVCEIECRDRKCGLIWVEQPKLESEGGDCFLWGSVPEEYRHLEIIRYRIRKPRGLTILEGLLENLPDEVPA